MAKMKCKLIAHSVSHHLQQVYTGFFLLHKLGIIDLTQAISREEIIDQSQPQHLRDQRHAHLRVVLDDNINLYYDTHDSWEIDEKYLSESDFYFKRSYDANLYQSLGAQQKKIHPLGLNYLVYPNALDKFGVRRNLALVKGGRKVSEMIRSSNFLGKVKFDPRENNMWSFPDKNLPPKILFMVRAYDPHDNSDRSSEKAEERREINEARAECIKMLRKEFGDKFFGGFIHTDFSKKNYKEWLMPDNNLSSKENYINLLKSFSVCLATTGLHKSIGWKFAEYIAFSKAVLTEKLHYEVTGDLQKDKNYLEFNNPENCVENAAKLFSDSTLRNQIMTNNSRYYHQYMRPDSLVLNSLLTALSETSKG